MNLTTLVVIYFETNLAIVVAAEDISRNSLHMSMI